MKLSTIFLTTLSLAALSAQSIEPSELANPGKDSWLTYHGDYSGRRNTALSAITPENVASLKQVWKFNTGQNQAIKATPILVDGVMFITTPDNLGRSTRAPRRNSGTINTRPTPPSTSAIAELHSTKTPSISPRPTAT